MAEMRSGWFKIRVQRSELRAGKTEQLIGDITAEIRKIEAGRTVGVFIVRESGWVDLYLSPALMDVAGTLILQYWAAPCDPPPSTAECLFGSPEAIDQVRPQKKKTEADASDEKK